MTRNSPDDEVNTQRYLDDGSSSLSEIGDRAGHEDMARPAGNESDANDTEAETERLADSPQKQRKPAALVHTLTNAHCEDISVLSSIYTIPRDAQDLGRAILTL